MDYLSNAINPPKREDDGAGRIRELKSYIIESDAEIQREFKTRDMSFEVKDTGLEKMKILHASGSDAKISSEMFLDISDSRFLILHTNELSETVERITRELVGDLHHSFDHTWFHTQFLEQQTRKDGNRFNGLGVDYTSKHLDEDVVDSYIEDLKLYIAGSLAERIQGLVGTDSDIRRRMAYNRVRVMRGSGDVQDFVQDDIHNNGHFSVKRGKSVQDHLYLIDAAMKDYSRTMDVIEANRIGPREVEGRTLVEGSPFTFEFPNQIGNLQKFVFNFFCSKQPFKMWGMKTKIREDYFKIMAVDLHTGSPMDFEIANDMMRVYLFKGSCGNTILRLLTNLQTYFDSEVRCPQVTQIAGK